MKVTNENHELQGNLIKSDDTYKIIDNTILGCMAISSTDLYPGKNTRGHSHIGQEEVYMFVNGTGYMTIGDEDVEVSAGSIVAIPDGAFHKVYNTDTDDVLRFICVFEGNRNH